MASEHTGSEEQAEASHRPRECMACRASGRVISNLGASTSTVTCPWCEGSGVRPASIDAQARWLGEDDHRSDTSGETPDAAA